MKDTDKLLRLHTNVLTVAAHVNYESYD